MQRYILKRLGQAVVCVFAVSVVIFMLTRLSGDPARLMVPIEAGEEQYQMMRKTLGVDKPLYVQYIDFLGGYLRGDFGRSFRWREPALPLVLGRLTNTVQLVTAGMLFALVIGIPVGILSAVKPGGAFDTFAKVFAVMGQSMPVFWVGLMLMLVFAVYLGWLPTSGMGEPQRLIMPAVTLGWYSMAAVTRLTRSAMLDVMDKEYIKLARVKGMSETLVIVKHAFRNAAIPVITLASLQFVALLSNAVVTESVFAWPGIGRLSVEAIFARDYPVVQTIVMVASLLYIGVNLAVDVLYGYLDPRIRYR